jgi:hypothetical protein
VAMIHWPDEPTVVQSMRLSEASRVKRTCGGIYFLLCVDVCVMYACNTCYFVWICVLCVHVYIVQSMRLSEASRVKRTCGAYTYYVCMYTLPVCEHVGHMLVTLCGCVYWPDEPTVVQSMRLSEASRVKCTYGGIYLFLCVDVCVMYACNTCYFVWICVLCMHVHIVQSMSF